MEVIEMRKSSAFATLIFIVILGIGGGLAFATNRANMENAWIGVIAFVIAIVVYLSIKVADQLERVVYCGWVSSAPSRDRDCFSLSRLST